MSQDESTPTPRDRAEEFIADRFDRLTTRPVKLRAEATKILDALGKKDPDAWNDFVTDVAVEVVVSRGRSYLAAQRHASMHAERSSVFRTLRDDTVVAIRSGRPMPSPFDNRYSVPTRHNDWVRFGELTRPDLLALAAHRTKLATTNAIEAIYFSVTAARLPDDTTTVEEALTEDDVLSLHEKAETSDLGELPTPTDTDTDKDQK